jgi:hypothetical protein
MVSSFPCSLHPFLLLSLPSVFLPSSLLCLSLSVYTWLQCIKCSFIYRVSVAENNKTVGKKRRSCFANRSSWRKMITVKSFKRSLPLISSGGWLNLAAKKEQQEKAENAADEAGTKRAREPKKAKTLSEASYTEIKPKGKRKIPKVMGAEGGSSSGCDKGAGRGDGPPRGIGGGGCIAPRGGGDGSEVAEGSGSRGGLFESRSRGREEDEARKKNDDAGDEAALWGQA